MYQFSRAIYRELARDIDGRPRPARGDAHEHVCGRVRRPSSGSSTDRHYFARPSRTLFNDIRVYFPMRAQPRVWRGRRSATSTLRDEYLQRQPRHRPRRQRPAAAVPRDDAPRHAVPARPAPPQRLLPVAPAPRRDRGAGARGRRLARSLQAPMHRDSVRGMLLGVDVGGTFTDAVLVGRRRAASPPRRRRRRTTSREGVLAAVERGARARRRAAAATSSAFAHGMTVGDQRAARGRAARARRSSRPRASPTSSSSAARRARDLYRLCAAHPAPLVPPERRFGAPRADRARRRAATRSTTRRRRRGGRGRASPEAVAVCLLHAYRHPGARARARRRAARAPRRRRPRLALARGRRHVPRVRARRDDRGRRRAVAAARRATCARSPARARDGGLPEPRIMQSSGGLAGARARPPSTRR